MGTLVVTPWGMLLPESTLHTHGFVVLTAFVAVNTLVYVTLSVVKSLPRVHLGDWLPRRYARRQTRSIYPDAPP